MDDLKTSIETMRIDEKHKSRIFTVILYNLSKYLGLAKKYKEAIKICDYSKKICIETSNYENLPGIIYNKAYVLYELGYKDVCERLIYIAYDMLEGMERYKERDIVKDYAKDRMGIVIEVKGKQDNGY